MKTIRIPNSALMGDHVKCYNGSIVEWQNQLYLFYRYEPAGGFETDIAMCPLGGDFMPHKNRNIKLNVPRYDAKVLTVDDPRAIVWREKLWFVHCQAYLEGNYNWHSAMGMCSVDRFGTPMSHIYPRYGRDGKEKNWSPFIFKGRLFFVYSIWPLVVLELDISTREIKEVPCLQAKTMPWPEREYGIPRGGTPLIPCKLPDPMTGDFAGCFMGFFHSSVENKVRNCQRQYSYAAYTIAGDPSKGIPFRLTSISGLPIRVAEDWPDYDMRDKSVHKWMPNVVFPCGLIEKDSMLHVSYGVHDCRIWIDSMTWDEAYRDMEPVVPFDEVSTISVPAAKHEEPKSRVQESKSFVRRVASKPSKAIKVSTHKESGCNCSGV